MNNSQFRNLLQNDKSTTTTRGSLAFKPPTLGSRARPSAPMTPRSVGSQTTSRDFGRQVDGQTRQADGQPALKKFKSTSAPKGTKFAPGYEDRTSQRQQHEEEQTSKEKKLKELEDMVKSEKIDQATFEKLRDQMGVGGDLGSTHLIKGLDRKLLERIRRGEDLNAAPAHDSGSVTDEGEVDDELDSVLDRDVIVKPRGSDNVSGDTEPNAAAPSLIMTRDEILRRLRESRNAESEPVSGQAHVLSDKFKRLSSAEKSGKKKFIETVNGRRREVLVITAKDGKTKRKTRWIDPEDTANATKAAPLGMEVPAELVAKQKALLEKEAAEDEDDDIFQGVGTDYDPLKGINSESEDSEKDGPPDADDKSVRNEAEKRPRNYFGAQDTAKSTNKKANPLTQDSSILAALKRAAALRQSEGQETTGEDADADPEKVEKRKQFLAKLNQQAREDAADMDLGFGVSRFGDDDDEEGPIWEGGEEREGKKRKRGPKKRKGDKDNVADVMSVLDGRKKS
jgi:RED-like protein N-terminal region